jgi:hypothetical protein
MPFNIGGNIYNGGEAKVQDYKNIITRGLLFHMDASTPESYPGSGTVWSDMGPSGYTGTLTNGPTYSTAGGGTIVFDGTNDYVVVPDAAPLRLVGNSTMCLWVKPTVVKNYGNLIWKANYPSNGYGLISLSNGDVQLQISPSPGPNPAFGAGTIVNNVWCYLSVTINTSNSVVFYKNGTATVTTTTSYPVLTGTTTLRIGADTDNSRYFNGSMAVVQMYDRVLSAAEVAQNYNIQRNRFGI